MEDKDSWVIAKELIHAQDNNIQIELVTSRFRSFDIDDAYEVARLIHEQRLSQGMLPVGRKIGFTNSSMWPVYGVNEPIWSYMYDRTVTQLTERQGVCFIAGYSEPKIEPELVLHFNSAPSANMSPSELLACVDWIALGFEVVQSHFPGWKFQAADTVVDRGLHAELFVGKPVPLEQLGNNIIRDLETFEVSLSCNGEQREVGCGANVLGSPLKAVLYLLSVLSKQSNTESLKAGELVTTGTLTSVTSVNAGELWSASVDGILLPGLQVQFEQE